MPDGSPDGPDSGRVGAVNGVLVVDDSPAVRRTVEEGLARLEVPEENATILDSGDEALRVFSSLSPDLVLLDTSMPGIDPYDVVQAMLLEDPDTRVVPLTEKPPDDPSVSELFSFGAFDVLRKPIRGRDLKELFRTIDEEHPGRERIP